MNLTRNLNWKIKLVALAIGLTASLAAFHLTGFGAKAAQITRTLSAGLAGARVMKLVSGFAAALAAPTLGNYPNAAVTLGGTTTVTPDAMPSNATSITVATNTNFKGTFAADPVTGIVRVTNAHPAGTYPVTVTAFDTMGAATAKNFTLTVQTSTACTVTPTFTSAADVGVGTLPSSVAIGDFNGDGKQDFAAANEGSGTVSIRLGDGMGGFSGTTNVGVGSGPVSVAISDFNGDGKQDLAVANSGSGTVSIRLGNGMGGFSGTTNVGVGSFPSFIAIGDFNGDGKQDFAAANFNSNTVSIRLGDGLGGFSGTTDVGVVSSPESVAIGDFNGDGKQDLAIDNGLSVSIRLGDGQGGFSGTTNVGVGVSIISVAIGDFNGDGNQDFVAGVSGTSSQHVYIRLGDGLGGFSGTTQVQVGDGPKFVTIGDFNGDGKQDLAATNDGSNSVSIRLGNGLGGFSGGTDLGVGLAPRSVAIGDFNGDGIQDFATANKGGNVSIWLGACSTPLSLGNYPNTAVTLGGSATVTPTAAPLNATSIQVATNTDFKGTFAADPATGIVRVTNAHPAGTYPVTVTAFNGTLRVQKSFTLTVQPSPAPACNTTTIFSNAADAGVGISPRAVAIGDFNGDGKQDFAAANYVSNTVSIRLGDGLGGFSGSTEVSVGTLPIFVAIGDFNGDGKQDFAAANFNSNTVSIRLGDGLGGFSGTTNVSVGTNPNSVAIGDFNGDGKQDFATASNGTNVNTVSIRLGDGLGGFSGTTEVSVGMRPVSVAIGDFNGDGKQDLAAANFNSDTVSIRLGDGLGGFSGTTEIGVGTNPNSVAIGDFNRDGRQDFAVANFNSANVSIRLGDGAGGFSGTTEVSVGTQPRSVAIGDFNGDGKQDVAAANNPSATVSIRLGDGMGGFSGTTNVSVGAGAFSVAIGDFNGDGRQDFATANSGFSYVSIRLGGCDLPPTLTPAGLTLTAGQTVSGAIIGNTADPYDVVNTLQIEISSDGGTTFSNTATLNGVTVTLTDSNAGAAGINPNAMGQVLADVAATCAATNATFKLRATDGIGQTDTKDFSVITPHVGITLGASPTIGQGTTGASLPYTATTGSPNQYSIDYDAAAESAGFVDVAAIALPASPIGLVVPGMAPLATYNGTLTVGDGATGCVSNGVPFTVTVLAPPMLGNYPNATVTLGGSTTVTPDAAPLNTTSIQVATNTNFKGTIAADPVTGIVRVTNAHPAGTYPVTMTAFNGIVSLQKTFTLTVQPGPACNTTTFFTSAADVDVGSIPYSVAVGDFNGDGNQDIAAASGSSGTVSIRLGNGTGGFSGTTNVSVGPFPISVAIGDFNRDGKQDFAATNGGSNTVSIRLGDGLGGFSGTTNVSVGSSPWFVAIGDFNGDGKQDFAATNLNSATVSIRLGDGMGGFSGTTNVGVGTLPREVAIGDFNGDGKQDLATANQGTHTVSIRLGDGLGGFSGTTNVSVGSQPISVAIGDFNGDGKQDFAAANIDDGTVSIRLGDGLGGFTGTTDVGVGSYPVSVAIGDFNGDGKQDFAAANFNSNTVSIRLGDGLGGFTGTTDVDVGGGPSSVAIGDFNGDGRQDFAVANNFSDTVSIRLGACSIPLTLGNYPNATVTIGGSATVTPDAAPLSTTSIQVATNTNFKGTFVADPVTGIVRVTNAHPAGTYLVTVTAFDTMGATTTKNFTLTVQPGPACNTTTFFTSAADVDVGSIPYSVAVGDFNGDGKQDIAAASGSSGTVSIRLGNGMGGFSGTTNVSVGPFPISVAIGDFNGDGKQDFAATNGGSNTVSIRLGDGLGGFSGTTNVGVGSSPWFVAIGDFNGDGKQDFAATNLNSATVSIRLGDGMGGFSGTTNVGVGTLPREVAIGDFNGDGKQDLATANQGTHTVSIRLGDGLGGFSGTTNVSVGSQPISVAIGDFNGDGKQDFAAANIDDGTVSIRLGDGLGGFTGTTDVGVGSYPVSVAIGDFNGDGKQDFAAANFNSNTVSIRLGDGLGGFTGTTHVDVGGGPSSVAIGDFNGDGRQDFAVANNFSDTVSIRLGACSIPLTLGNYPNATVTIGGSATVTPDAAPLSTTSIQVATNTNFKGTFVADPATGIVRVTNAHPAGMYLVTVTAFDTMGATTTKNFTLTVQPGPACNATTIFTGTTDVGVGTNPISVAIGDFNGDGKQDLAAANQNSNTVSIRLGDGLGGFSGTTDVSVGANPVSVAIGDFNGDGRQDFATANIGSGTVSIRLGDGLGAFSGSTDVAIGTSPVSVAIGDFNGDGKQDFATANSNANTVSIRLGDGMGGFSGSTDVGVGSSPAYVAIGDFNGDGKQDFATANYFSNTVSIRLGDGIGGFSGTTEVGVGSNPQSVAIGDFNGDGKQDFAAANADSNTVSIRLGDGTGGFSGSTDVAVGSSPLSVAIGDFNGDGKQDFAAANAGPRTVSIRLGDGMGGFSVSPEVGVGSGSYSVAIGDFNGDGRQDFATANYLSANVSIRLGGCQPTMGNYPNATVTIGGSATVMPTATPLSASSIQVATNTDFKGTFAADPVTGIVQVTNAHPVGTYPVTVTAFNGTVSLQKSFMLTVQPGPACNSTTIFTGTTNVGVGSSPRAVAIGDFNGDGKQDFAAANYVSNTVSIRLGDGLGGFSGSTEVNVGTLPVYVAIGDFNGDGRQDFATANFISNTVSIRLGDGLGGFSGSTEVSVGTNPNSVAIGDFNGDGRQDFATANNGTNINTVSIRLGDGMGGFSGTTNVSVGTRPVSVAIGDFNGDGKQDFAAANFNSDTVSIRLGDGLGGFSGSTEVGVSTRPVSVAIGDFNGDGKQDFATANLGSDTVSIRLGDGAGGFSGSTNISVGTQPRSVAIGDFNGDGKQDFAVANNPSATVSIRLGDGLGGFSGPTNVGVGNGPISVALGDFNGDGRHDFITANAGSTYVSIRLGGCDLPPTIMPAGLTLTAGQTAGAATIAAAVDAEDALNTLQLAVSSDGGATFSNTATLNGVTVTLTDSNAVATGINPNALGQVLADVVTACGATSAAFKLRVIDSQGSFNEATLNVTMTANTPPELSYAVQNVIEGTGLSVNPATGPSDNGSISTIVVQDKGTFTGTVSVNAAGVVTISGAAPVGSHTITIRATDNCGATTDASLVVAVSKVTGSIADPAVCNGPGGVVDVTATVTNGSNSPQSATFTATLPAGLSALPGTCTANVGTCTVANASTVNWSGTPGGGQTVTISYKAQFGDTVTTGTTLCITSSATVGGSAPASVQACATLNCPAPSPGLPVPTVDSVGSDQIAGSVLIYNLYTSSIDANRENTRISLTNIEPSRNAYVHLFFVDGSSCTVADSYICLTPNQTTSFLASDFDPGTTGYLIAVAVDERGCPVSFNHLIGDAYIKMASGHAANLGAEAVPAVAGGMPLCDGNSITALLNFDGTSYARLPRTLALSNIASPVDGNETRLVLNRIGGNMTTSASPLGPIFGILYDDTESGVSFTFNPGACQYRAAISNNFPRTTPRFGTMVPSGRSGWMKLYQTADQAMLGAAINYNANAAGAAAAFNQGHNLHKLTLTSAASLTIPVFPAGC